MILLLGDSNLRKTIETYGDQLKEELEIDYVFEQTTTNESIDAALEKERNPRPTIVYVNSILNEISNRVSRGKAIVDVIKNVTLEQNDIINKHANKMENSASLFLICNPMMRYEPKWYEERLSLVHYYINKHNVEFSPNNVSTVAELEITQEDLDSDKVHLNEKGRKKMYEKMAADLKIAKEELDKFLTEGMEWDDLARLSQKTPKTAKKRKRADQEGGSSEIKKRKEGDNESILDTLKSFMAEIREDRKLATLQTNKLDEEVTKLKESEVEIRQEIETIKSEKESSNTFNATVRSGCGGK
jgi:lysophospholipase L1-like esterase